MSVLRSTAMGTCPGGFCDLIKDFSEVLVVILCIDGLIFFVTLIPPIFNWQTKKPDGKKRIWFAALACITFYFWLAFLALNTVYCFGFLAHEGPCKAVKAGVNFSTATVGIKNTQGLPPASPTAPFNSNSQDFHHSSSSSKTTSTKPTSKTSPTSSSSDPFLSPWPSAPNPTQTSVTTETTTIYQPPPQPPIYVDQDVDYGNSTDDYGAGDWQQQEQPQVQALITWTASNSTKTCSRPAGEHESELKNMTLVNILIIVVAIIVLLANAREAINAKALYHKEILCKKEEVQRFLSSLVMKPPEVGHLVNCFHVAKLAIETKKKGGQPTPAPSKENKSGPPRKVITFSAIENFTYQTWRDFSDLRLIEPSGSYPIIEVEIALNFFPGDHFTAERYKEFVQHLTKQHQSKDAKISIDDYFHVEDHREWTFFIGNPEYISPWWDKLPAKIVLSCIFLIGWPFRMSYKGRVGKHVVEVKKAVFVEYSSQDEGVSLSATPGSSTNNNNHNPEQQHNSSNNSSSNNRRTDEVECEAANNKSREESVDDDGDAESVTQDAAAMRSQQRDAISDASSSRLDGVDAATSARSNAKNEHRVDAVISCPPRDINSPDGVAPNWQGQQYVIEQIHRQPQQQQQQHLQQHHNQQQERMVQELQQHIQQHNMQQQQMLLQQQQQQQQQLQQQNRYQFQLQDNCRNTQFSGPSLPTTLGSVGTGIGRTGVVGHHQAASYSVHNHPLLPTTPPMPPQRSAPLTSPRTHLRETTKDIVTAVAHSDINGMSSAVNTVALKDIDIQLTALSGYETYV